MSIQAIKDKGKAFFDLERDFLVPKHWGRFFILISRPCNFLHRGKKTMNRPSAASRYKSLTKLQTNPAGFQPKSRYYWLPLQILWQNKAKKLRNTNSKSKNEKIHDELTEKSKDLYNSTFRRRRKNQNYYLSKIPETRRFVSIRYTGTLPTGSETPNQNGIQLSVKYFLMETRYRLMIWKLGDSFTVECAILNPTNTDLENLVLDIPIPTAWEMLNERLGEFWILIFPLSIFVTKYLSIWFENHQTKTFQFTATITYGARIFYPPQFRARQCMMKKFEQILLAHSQKVFVLNNWDESFQNRNLKKVPSHR